MSTFQPRIPLPAGQTARRIVQQADGKNATRTIIFSTTRSAERGVNRDTDQPGTGGANAWGKTVGRTGRRSAHGARAEIAMETILATMIAASGLHVTTTS